MSNTNNHQLPYRRSVRLQTYDYSQPGYYFVTVCTQHMKPLLGHITDGTMFLNKVGQLIQVTWRNLPARFTHVEIDQYVIMPNHFHGIIIFGNPELFTPDITYKAKIPVRFQKQHNKEKTPLSPIVIANANAKTNQFTPLGEVIRTFKAVATRNIRKTIMPNFSWQRGLYEHIIRNDKDLYRVQQYIINNPAKWTEDILMKNLWPNFTQPKPHS